MTDEFKYQYETNYFSVQRLLLTKPLPEDTLKSLDSSNAIIAGGAVTSVFQRIPINDYDLYFFNSADLNKALSYFQDDNNGWDVESETTNALTFTDGKVKLQTIKRLINSEEAPSNVVEKVEALLDTFDLTVCMAAYSIRTKSFTMYKNFLKDLAEKQLCVNPYQPPTIASFARIQKYINKGFNIDLKEYIPLLLTFAERYKSLKVISDLDILFEGLGKNFNHFRDFEFKENGKLKDLDLNNENLNELLDRLATNYVILDSLSKKLNVEIEY